MPKPTDAELADTRHLPGAERGDPTYFENEVIDHLIGIVLELGAQLWVTRDRLAFLEEKLGQQGVIDTAELDSGRPTEATQARLRAEREAMIRQTYARLYSRYGGDEAESTSAPMS
jgi:hypothetical protein